MNLFLIYDPSMNRLWAYVGEDGIIQMKIGASSDSWDSKWCVFEEGVLKHAPYIESKTISESSFDLIPMDKVIKLRTDVSTPNLNHL